MRRHIARRPEHSVHLVLRGFTIRWFRSRVHEAAARRDQIGRHIELLQDCHVLGEPILLIVKQLAKTLG